MTDWGELYAHIAASTGWTWDTIAEHVDLPRLDAMNRYWADHPPMHVMVAAYFGIKPKQKTDPRSQAEELLSMFPVEMKKP